MWIGQLCHILSDDQACEGCKCETCKGSDEGTDHDIAEVVLADEDAADGDHEGPEEYPCVIDLSPTD